MLNSTGFTASYYGSRGVRALQLCKPWRLSAGKIKPSCASTMTDFLDRLAADDDLEGIVVSHYIIGANIPVNGGYTQDR